MGESMTTKTVDNHVKVREAAAQLAALERRLTTARAELDSAKVAAEDRGQVKQLALAGDATLLEKHLAGRATRLMAGEALVEGLQAAVAEQRDRVTEARQAAAVEIVEGAKGGIQKLAKQALAAWRQFELSYGQLQEATTAIEAVVAAEGSPEAAAAMIFPLRSGRIPVATLHAFSGYANKVWLPGLQNFISE
jgi:hypothetical protein